MIKLICQLIRGIFGFFTKHKRSTSFGIAGIGIVGFFTGLYKADKAKKINCQAIEIQQIALDKYKQAEQETKSVLEKLGRAEKDAIDSFIHFADTMGKIHGRPKFKSNVFSAVKLPNYEPEEIKTISVEIGMAIDGVIGAGVGGLAGLAAFGAGALLTGPAIAGAGLILCVKGFSLNKKAIESMRQAKQLEKSVDEIVTFYSELQKEAELYRRCLNAVYIRYTEGLRRVDDTLATKNSWQQLSWEEKKNVENTVMLARLLYEMTKTEIVLKKEKEDQLEAINTVEILKLKKQANKLLEEIA